MNLFKQLFGRHPHTESSIPSTHHWLGESGKEYTFDVYSLDAVFQSLPGVYIYARLLADGDWVPVYISQTRDLHQRLEGGVRLSDAMANGATHLHAHYSDHGQGARCSEETDLIHRWRPVCNEAYQS